MKNLDIELLRTFIHVANNKSFTKTASEIFKSQSAVSMQIKRLEESMDCKLFSREKKSVTLTKDGRFFLTSAKRIVNLNDELLSSFEKVDTTNIRIGFPDDYATLFLPEILSLYSNHFTDVELEVVSDSSKNLIDALHKKTLDIAISINFDSNYGNVIRKEKLFWVSSKDFSPESDISIPLALFPENCIIRKTALEEIENSEHKWHLAFSGVNIATIHSLIAQGSAVSVLGESMMPAECKVLNESQGFPPLPSLIISINKREDEVQLSVNQLYEYIISVVSDKQIPPISRFGN